jgi:hypothetical protein
MEIAAALLTGAINSTEADILIEQTDLEYATHVADQLTERAI